jgi:hypothetical protein
VSDYLPPVVVELEGRDTQLRRTLESAKAEVRRFAADVGRMNATADIKLDIAAGEIQKLQRRIGAIKATVRVGFRLDDTATRASLDELTRDRTVTIRTRTVGGSPSGDSGGAAGGAGGGGLLAALMPLAPALVPVAAQAAAVAASVGAATVAVGAFGVAVKSQLTALTDAADAQQKYKEAVAKYGAGSTQAAQAQQLLTQTLAGMPAATRQAAGAFMVLKSDFKNWSDSLAKFTMVPVTQGLGILDALLPKLSPLVQGAAAQFTRLTTALAGGINSGGFDGLMSKFTVFANGALKSAVDGVIHFARVLAQGSGSGAVSQFMAYVKSTGPLVGETLKNLGSAVMNILKASSEAGPGMLALVNAFAKLVAAVPPSVLATLMQVAAAMKLISLTRAGITPLVGSVTTLMGRFTTLRSAATAAGGGLAGLRAAFMSLSVAARATVIVAVIAAIGVAVAKLASLGQKAPPDIDKLTNSLGRLGQTGQVNGEALKAFGANLGGLRDSIKSFVAPSVLDNIQQGIIKVVTLGNTDSTPVKEAKGNLDAIDKALANLVQSGHADLAASALDKLKAAYGKGGHDVTNFTKNLKDYKKSVDDAKFASELTAQSQGLFGEQALKVQAALDKQKAAAEGLQQAILDLNDTNRSALDAESAYQQAIDDATKAIKGHRDALHMTNGQLDLGSQAARDAYGALSQLASAAEQSATATLKQTGSQDKANRVLIDAHDQLVRVAQQMGLSSSEANALADKLDNIKDPKIQVTVNKMNATRDLNAFNAALKAAPGAKSVTLKTLSATAETILKSFGYKVTHLKDGSVKVSAKTGGALGAIGNVQAAVNALDGKTATVTVMVNHQAMSVDPKKYYSQGPHAHGGPIRRASGGAVQMFPGGGYIEGPGTPTSDSILGLFASGAAAQVSQSEYVVQAAAVRKYGVRFLDALNAGTLQLPGFARGGLTAAQKKAQAQAEAQARAQLVPQLGISRFGKVAGYHTDSLQKGLGTPGSLNDLVGALNGLHGQIKAAFSGRTESSLLTQLAKAGKSLISYDKQLSKVTSSLASAKTKLDDLKNSAAQLKDSVASSIMSGVSIVTQAPQQGLPLTSTDVVNSLNAQVQSATQFSAQLQTLKKRGLSADLLQQIAAAGVDQGGATAAALVGASSAQIKQINSLQTTMKKSADAAGSAVADSMYGAGIKAADGLVKGLEKQQKNIEAAMMKIANSMQSAIKHALGIKSPSTVMARLGDFTAQGFAHGIDRSSKHAVIAARGMAMSVAQGAALTGTPSLTASMPALTAAAPAAVVHHHYEPQITVEGHVLTERGLRDVVQEQMLRLGSRNSATWQPYKR